MARFQEYLSKLAGDGEILLPLVTANPMAREPMLAFVDRLDAMGADAVLADACAEAERRLAHVPLDTRVSLTPVDNVGGAWSDMASTDFEARFPDRLAKRGTLDKYRFLTALVFVSEPVTPQLMRERVLAAVYRAAFLRARGAPLRVRDMMQQEGNALRFAGLRDAGRIDLASARVALAPHLDATDAPTRFAAMYGDAAARRLGHRPLGLPENAGFAVALAEALASSPPPESLV